MTVILRQKVEPGSLCALYLFQHQTKFTSCLGNEENSDKYILVNKVVSTFKGRPLLHLKHFLYGECIACYDETHKIQVNVLR